MPNKLISTATFNRDQGSNPVYPKKGVGYNMSDDNVTFTKKQIEVILLLMGDLLQNGEDDSETDSLQQSAIGPYLDLLSDEELKHFGVMGMKWGVWRTNRRNNKQQYAVEKLEERQGYGRLTGARGKKKVRALSRRNARYSADTTKRVRKLTRYLHRDANGGYKILKPFFKFKSNPVKVAAVKEALAKLEVHKASYKSLGDRLNSLKLDVLLEG